jgi:hypothetical protein
MATPRDTDDPHQPQPAARSPTRPARRNSTTDQALMRARLAAMAAPRETDSPRVAALRAILRDEALMAHVTAHVEQWPPLSEDQAATLAALLHPQPGQPARRRAA